MCACACILGVLCEKLSHKRCAPELEQQRRWRAWPWVCGSRSLDMLRASTL